MKANKKHKNLAGIYMIKNLVNNKVYIGKSINIYARIWEHIHRLNKGISDSPHLQNSWTKYSSENFEYSVLEVLDDVVEIAKRELFWMTVLNTLDKNYGYNLRSDSDSQMIVHESTRKKISSRLKKEWSEGIRKEHGQKLSANWKTTPNRRKIQAKVLSKVLTKYQYKVNNRFLDYKRLKRCGLKNVIATFHKQKINKVLFRGISIERIKLNG